MGAGITQGDHSRPMALEIMGPAAAGAIAMTHLRASFASLLAVVILN